VLAACTPASGLSKLVKMTQDRALVAAKTKILSPAPGLHPLRMALLCGGHPTPERGAPLPGRHQGQVNSEGEQLTEVPPQLTRKFHQISDRGPSSRNFITLPAATPCTGLKGWTCAPCTTAHYLTLPHTPTLHRSPVWTSPGLRTQFGRVHSVPAGRSQMANAALSGKLART